MRLRLTVVPRVSVCQHPVSQAPGQMDCVLLNKLLPFRIWWMLSSLARAGCRTHAFLSSAACRWHLACYPEMSVIGWRPALLSHALSFFPLPLCFSPTLPHPSFYLVGVLILHISE